MDNILNQILTSRKYRNLDESLISTSIKVAMRHTSKEKEIIKEAKGYLHTIYGAFWNGEVDFNRMYRLLESAYTTSDSETYKILLRKCIEKHSSTNELLSFGAEFYSLIEGETGPIKSVLDLGCGLNPLLWIYLGKDKETPFYAYDIDSAQMEFINKVAKLFNYNIKASPINLLNEIPSQSAHIGLFLKMIPTLEFQMPGRAVQIIEEMHTNYVVVSFPTRNLGRVKKNKGMNENYKTLWHKLTQNKNWEAKEYDMENQLVYVLKK